MENMYFTSLNEFPNAKPKQNLIKKGPWKIESIVETNFKTLLNKPSIKFNQFHYSQKANLPSFDKIDPSSDQLSQSIIIPVDYDTIFKYDDSIYFLINWRYLKYDQKLKVSDGAIYSDIYHCSEQYYSKVFHLNYSMFEKSFLIRFINTAFHKEEFELFFGKLNQIKSNQTDNQIDFEEENDQSQMDALIDISTMIILIVLAIIVIIWIVIVQREAKQKRKTDEKVQFINQEKPGINVIFI